MTDVLESNRVGALARGADAVADSTQYDVAAVVREFFGETADVVFDCVSIQSTIDAAFDMVGRGGTVVMVGVPSQPVQIPSFRLQDRQIRLQCAATYMRENYEEAIRIIAPGGVDANQMITASFPLDSIVDAFAAVASGGNIKVLVTGDGVDLGRGESSL